MVHHCVSSKKSFQQMGIRRKRTPVVEEKKMIYRKNCEHNEGAPKHRADGCLEGQVVAEQAELAKRIEMVRWVTCTCRPQCSLVIRQNYLGGE